MESVLIQNGTIAQSDLTSGGAYSVFRRIFGPFGSVDLKRVQVPISVLNFSLQFRDTLAQLRVGSYDFSNGILNLPTITTFAYFPPPWVNNPNITSTVGGNLLCNEVPAYGMTSGQLLLSGFTSSCGSILGDFITYSATSSLLATVALNMFYGNVTTNMTNAICATTALTLAQCTSKLLLPSMNFLSNTSIVTDPTLLPSLREKALVAQKDMLDLGVHLIQYGLRNSDGNITFLKDNIFDPRYPVFHYNAWYFTMDWAVANREVLSFQGDKSSLNVLTSPLYDVASLVNPLEIPVNVAFYIRYACFYVTMIIICVAVLASIYLFMNKGYVEGLNLFELNRVAGIVWIGRTFLFIRSMAAICLLSTEVLSLDTINRIWHLVSASDVLNESPSDKAIRVLKVFLAAGEVSWLGFVLSDIFMVVTAQYTPAYVFKCNFMVWGIAALLSWASPATHTATMQRQCTQVHVDY
ncbi:hypothetical protein LEN26_013272 [Aphanomyces euteiches]|nr:hypothetical protein LEN26_013272 [Aphanomyces euteiches]